MPDVITKAVPVLGFQQGSALLFVTPIGSGTTKFLRPVLNEVLNSGITDTKLTGRFDDYLYYST